MCLLLAHRWRDLTTQELLRRWLYRQIRAIELVKISSCTVWAIEIVSSGDWQRNRSNPSNVLPVATRDSRGGVLLRNNLWRFLVQLLTAVCR